MKKLLRVFLVVSGFAGAILLSGFTAGDPADVIKDIGCGISSPWGQIFTEESIQVANHGGNVTLVCHANGVYNPSGMDWEDWGFPCGTFYGGTINSYKIITADGNAMLRCQIKKEK